MARAHNKLSARKVAALAKAGRPGRHSDGGGLYLSISSDGLRCRWVFLFRWRGKPKEMGLGGASSVSLARARELAAECRDEVAAVRNPIETRAEAANAAKRVPTFG